MSTMPTGKSCTRCAADVDGKPRVKDAKGRYLCRPCFDVLSAAKASRSDQSTAGDDRVRIAGIHPGARAEAAAAQGPDLSTDDNALIFDLAPSPGSVAKAGGPCPTCGRYLPRDVKLCVNCGYNTATGANLGTSVGIDKVKTSKEDERDAHLAAESREQHRKAYRQAIGVLVAGIIGMFITIAAMTDDPTAYAQFYMLTLVLSIVGSFLAFVLFSLAGYAGGAGFILILLEVSAICAAFMPLFVITTLFPLPRTARWGVRALVLGGLSAWLLDMDEPYNYVYAGVVFFIMVGSMYGAAAIMSAQVG